jgi:tetratricopeptide (TPR) repeat protein
VISRSVAAHAAWMLGDFARADALIGQALDAAGRSRDPRERAFVALHAADLEVNAGRAADAARRAAEAVALCDEYGVVSERFWNEGYLGVALAALGRRGEAIATLRRAIATLEGMQSWVVLTVFYAAVAHALVEEGALADVRECAAAGLAVAERTGELLGVPALLRARAATRGVDERAAAHADLTEAAAVAAATEARVDAAWVAVDHARLLAEEGRTLEARARLDAVRAAWTPRPPVPSAAALDELWAALGPAESRADS